ncbi:MAG TPA: aminoacyl--tRNA ligase-related protein [Ktedonobacteraceae bacterium]|nr:aminoacyl--tRNA ligase-related protein [Ktedonobacteraceae bacterium]
MFEHSNQQQQQQQLAEVQKIDQRKLGRELGLFMFSPEVGAGLPLWLPKGAVLRQTLERFEQQEQSKRGYLPVVTPHIGKIEMYKMSGHWYKYRDSMYPAMIENAAQQEQSSQASAAWMQTHDSCGSPVYSINAEPGDNDYVLKPMSCPHHIQIYKNELRSYRDLPLRLAEFGTVYRYEQSGELNGVLRSRSFTQVQKIPYMLIVGDKEMAEQTVSVRLRTNENLGDMPVASFIERVVGMIKTKSKEL